MIAKIKINNILFSKYRAQVFTVGIGQALNQVISLLRNVWFASVLTLEDFALGAIYLLIASALEMANDIHIDKFIISRNKTISKKALDSFYSINILKGLVVSLFFLTLYQLFTNYNSTYPSQLVFLCFIPILISIANIRVKYSQRFSKHVPNYIVEVGSQIVASVIALFAYKYYGSHLAVLITIFSLYLAKTIISHLFYKSANFRLSYLKPYFVEIWIFSGPLWINNIFLFATIHGERVLATTFVDLKSLAIYSLAFTIGFGIYGFVSRASIQILLPICARASIAHRSQLYNMIFLLLSFVSVLSLITLALGTNIFLGVLGEEYLLREDLFLMSMLTYLIRIPRIAPNIILTVENQTKKILLQGKYKIYQLFLLGILFYLGVEFYLILLLSIIFEVIIYIKAISLSSRFIGKIRPLNFLASLFITAYGLAIYY